jgi:hypothetical protein
MAANKLRIGCVLLLWASGAIFLFGCGSGRATVPDALVDGVSPGERLARMPTLQVARVDPSLAGQRYSVLLNFEIDADDAFVQANDGQVSVDTSHAMTGTSSLRIAPQTRSLTLKLGALLSGRAFPADWTLLGASFYAEKPAELKATLTLADGRTLTREQPLEPGQWSAAWVDISALPRDARAPQTLTYELRTRGDLWMDDLLMTENEQWFVGASSQSEPWSVHRRGYSVVVESPQAFRVTLDTAQAKPGGWSIEEISPLRVVLSSQGTQKRLVIYPDGRSYWDGGYRPLSPQSRSEPTAQDETPAALSVPEAMGRVNRRSDGDENNDGYNESLGAYQLSAIGPRIDVTISPRSAPLIRPVLEIAGLPQEGRILVTVEGRLVETAGRTPRGHVLVPLPFRIDRTTTVNVRVG